MAGKPRKPSMASATAVSPSGEIANADTPSDQQDVPKSTSVPVLTRDLQGLFASTVDMTPTGTSKPIELP